MLIIRLFLILFILKCLLAETLVKRSYDRKIFKAKIVVIILKGKLNDTLKKYDYRFVKPAIDLAIEKSKILYPKIDFQVTFRNDYHDCNINYAGAYAAEEYLKNGATFFVGPGCTSALESVAKIANYWNVPICTAGGRSTVFDNRKSFENLIRLSVTVKAITENIINLLKYFDWHHVSVITDFKQWFALTISNNLEAEFKQSVPYELFGKFQEFNYRRNEKTNFTNLLAEAGLVSRIIIILAEDDNAKKILQSASDLKMDNGDYVFICIEWYKNISYFGRFDANYTYYPKIYQSVLILSVHAHILNDIKLIEKIVKLSNEEFNLNVSSSNISRIVLGFYDCVMMYGYALNKIIYDNPKDGRNLVGKLKDTKYQNDVSGLITIDENGDSKTDFAVNQFDGGKIEPILINYAHVNGGFVQIENAKINWHGDKPPNDIPFCGFDGLNPKCLKKNLENRVTIKFLPLISVISFLLFIMTLIIGSLIYRKYKFESELVNLWWKVNWSDINFRGSHSSLARKSMNSVDEHQQQQNVQNQNENTLNLKGSKKPRKNSQRISSIHSTLKYYNDEDFGTRAGQYKGIKVVVKSLNIPKLTMTRQILLELKQVRDLVHDNIVRLIGLCSDSPNVAIITELCSRGSLQDLLQNESIHLDWTFRYSIINDIVNGMQFLHNSAIEYHGRLKSSNCVIDNRFVVKLSDYGLVNLMSLVVPEDEINYRILLWTSPEHLKSRNPLFGGSQKGDVYSFAIILQEIITRCGPFESFDNRFSPGANQSFSLEPEEIINLVRLGTSPPFRPILPIYSQYDENSATNQLRSLVHKCWDENPQARPTFTAIKTQLRRINKKDLGGANLLDNLLKRMEQYADNLEFLVEEKTAALLEEKKRSDELLYQLMPKFVVNQLKNGKHVTPEAFESVTVCFTDIVGFTKIAARSSPIEVVDLLNDLYTCFDSIICNFDIYKVETIGDAYMVVSGMPVRNQDHAVEIAKMSLTLLDNICNFKIKHLPGETFKLRVGFHSGPCAAGVIGSKMPRYCLFGDTVNTASRMESYSEAMKIHISEESKLLLDPLNLFDIELRGQINVKGKGLMTTYWLKGKSESTN